METRNKISANCIFVEAYVIYRVIYAKGFSNRIYRRAVLITRSLHKANIYMDKLRENFPDKVYELRMYPDGFTLSSYLETLSDIVIQPDLLQESITSEDKDNENDQ